MTFQASYILNGVLPALAQFPDVGLFLFATLVKEYWLTRSMKLSSLAGHVWTLLFLLVVVGISLFFISPWRQSILFGASFVLGMAMFVDCIYFRFFNDLPTASEVRHAPQLLEVRESVKSLMRWSDIRYGFDLPLWGLLCLIGSTPERSLQSGNLVPIGSVFTLACLFIGGICYFVATTFYTAHHRGLANYSRFAVFRRGVVAYHLINACQIVSRVLWPRPASQEEVAKVSRWFKEHRAVAQDTQTFGLAKGKNVICVAVESIQGFAIGLTINGHEVTPNLNRLSNRSCYFDHFFSQIGKGVSSDATFVVMNSLFPSAVETVAYSHVGNSFRGLATILEGHGYSTFATNAQYASFWNQGRMDRACGFVRGYYKPSFMLDEETNAWLFPDDKLFARCMDFIDDSERPFFAFLRTTTSHHPFKQVPAEFVKLDVGNLKGTRLGDYLVSLNFVDATIGGFLRTLDERGISDESLIIIYGDHEGGLDRDEIIRAIGDKFSCLDRNIHGRVPLYVVVPGNLEQRVISKPAGQIDIAPTILHLLGIPEQEACFMGSNLFDDRRQPLVTFPSGNFLNDGGLFLTTDGSFEGGKLFSTNGGTELDKELCAQAYRDAREQIRISDMILKHNLIPIIRSTLNASKLPSARPASKN